MATLDNLCDDAGPLTNVVIPLGRHEFQSRWFYGSQEVMGWLQTDLPQWRTGRLGADQTPRQQFFGWLHKWIVGHEMRYDRMFKDLMPAHDEAWEAKTHDIRVFGWMYRPMVFIAVHAGYADDYKLHAGVRRCSYRDAVTRTVTYRDALDLDPPKLCGGTFDALVHV